MTAEDLRLARRLIGMNQAQLSRALGISPSTLMRWERGSKIETPGMLKLALERLAQVHG